MKLLVSTKRTQGQRRNDFCYVPEGELVMFGFECDSEDVDGSCGCRRSLCGIESKTATTTFIVAEVAVTKEELVERVYNSLETGGWRPTQSWAKEEARAIIELGGYFEVGDIVERRGARRFKTR